MGKTPKNDTPKAGKPPRHATRADLAPETDRTARKSDPESEGSNRLPTAPKRRGGKPGRSGPPKGSANAMTHGLTANLRHGMQGGKLPKGCQHIENKVNSLRRQVEAALLAAKGTIDFVDAAAVNSILKWERHGLLAATWLRREAESLSANDRLKFSEAIAKASDNRDKALRSLNLNVKPSPWTIDVVSEADDD